MLLLRDVQLPAQLPRHVFHEPCLAATRRSLQKNRDALPVGAGKQLDLVVNGPVVRLAAHHEGFHGVFAVLPFRGVFGHAAAAPYRRGLLSVQARFESAGILPMPLRAINNGPVTVGGIAV